MTEISPYQQFAGNMLQNESRLIPEILKCMINREQARLLVSLPGNAGDLSVKLNRPVGEIERDLKDMFRKGLAFKKEKNGVLNWTPPLHIAQFHDATIVWPEATPEFYDLWQKYMEDEWPKSAPVLTRFLPGPFTRVIPIGKSIETGKIQVLAPESVRTIIKEARRLAVTKCICRLTMRKCDAPLEVCLQVNRAADYTIERGSGRELTREEAIEIIKNSEKAGLIHVTMNKADIGGFICNCCGCCCQSFSLLISKGITLCDPSRYSPQINQNVCVSCETCMDRCWFSAIYTDENHILKIDTEKCLGCGQCAVSCPEDAIKMVVQRDPEFIPH